MRLILDAETVYMVHFHRTKLPHHDDARKVTHITFCAVHIGPCRAKQRPCGTPAYTGRAVCSPLDQYVKATGRKIAFTRAIEPLPRDVRERLWHHYLELSPPKTKHPHSPPSKARGTETNHVGRVQGGPTT